MSAVAKTPHFAIPKVNKAIPKVNRAKAQSRVSGILSAQADGKLYFEFLKRISVPQNHLPHKGEVRYSEVMRPCSIKNEKLRTPKGSPKAIKEAQSAVYLSFNS